MEAGRHRTACALFITAWMAAAQAGVTQTSEEITALKKDLAVHCREFATATSADERTGLLETMAGLATDAAVAARAGLASAVAIGLKDRDPAVVKRCMSLLSHCADAEGGIRELLGACSAIEGSVRSLRQLPPVRLPSPPPPPALEGGPARGKQAQEQAARDNKAAIDSYQSRFRAWESRMAKRAEERNQERTRITDATSRYVEFSESVAAIGDARIDSSLRVAFRLLMKNESAQAGRLAPLLVQRLGRDGVSEVCQALADHRNFARILRVAIADDQLRELALNPPRLVIFDGGSDALLAALQEAFRLAKHHLDLEKRWAGWDAIADKLDRQEDAKITDGIPGLDAVGRLAEVVGTAAREAGTDSPPWEAGAVTVGRTWTAWFEAHRERFAAR